jgi:hypothetical protein
MKLRGMRSTTFVIFAVKNDGMSARNKGRSPSNGTTAEVLNFFENRRNIVKFPRNTVNKSRS